MSNTIMMNNETHIASLVVHYDPERAAEISKIISSLPGTELHDVEAPGKFVVLLEADDEKLITDNINTINVSAGVYSASLVYHHHEPAAALAEEIIT